MSNQITEADLRAMEARCEAATEGPWEWETPLRYGYPEDAHSLRSRDEAIIRLEDQYNGYPGCGQELRMDISKENMNFITASRADLPRLIAAYRERGRLLSAMVGEHASARYSKTSRTWFCDDCMRETPSDDPNKRPGELLHAEWCPWVLSRAHLGATEDEG